jgi:hypothetical protein
LVLSSTGALFAIALPTRSRVNAATSTVRAHGRLPVTHCAA